MGKHLENSLVMVQRNSITPGLTHRWFVEHSDFVYTGRLVRMPNVMQVAPRNGELEIDHNSRFKMRYTEFVIVSQSTAPFRRDTRLEDAHG